MGKFKKIMQHNKQCNLLPREIISNFNRVASIYDNHAIIQHHIGKILSDETLILKQKPSCILNIGHGPGRTYSYLRQLHPKINIYNIDLAKTMCHHFNKNYRGKTINADALKLPFISSSFDMVFSNCTLERINDYKSLFTEVQRVLTDNGSFFFSTLGPDTLHEIKESWQPIDNFPHAHNFVDMHHIGDALLKAKFQDPIMTRNDIKLEYDSVELLLSDLKNSASNNINPKRRKTMTGKNRWHKFVKELESIWKKNNS